MSHLIRRKRVKTAVRSTHEMRRLSTKTVPFLWIRRSKVRILPRQPISLTIRLFRGAWRHVPAGRGRSVDALSHAAERHLLPVRTRPEYLQVVGARGSAPTPRHPAC